MAHRTVSIGGATYDLFIRTGSETVKRYLDRDAFVLPLGDKIPVLDVLETCGGGACNSAVGLSRLGCDAGFSGVVGDDQWGVKLLENFRDERVDTRCTVVVEGEISSFSMILSASGGERVILYAAGTNEHLHDANFDLSYVKGCDWVYLNHIQRRSCIIQDDIAEALIADQSIRFTWNPGGCQIEAGLRDAVMRKLLCNADFVQFNKQEALTFAGTDSIVDALKDITACGAAIACVTDGSNGTVACDGKNIYRCPVVPVDAVVDTTGAGDAFGIGVTWALIEGLTLPTALKAGSINASSVVSHIGAQAGLLTDIEMRRQLEGLRLDVEVSALA